MDQEDFVNALLDIQVDSVITHAELLDYINEIEAEGFDRGLSLDRTDITEFLMAKWSEARVKDRVDTIIKLSDPKLNMKKIIKYVRKLIKTKGKVIALRHTAVICKEHPEHQDKFIRALEGMYNGR
tara:strand:- start:4212 stop:4589 length:378 start_codon:yes stop_codon:yes gene_type:complete